MPLQSYKVFKLQNANVKIYKFTKLQSYKATELQSYKVIKLLYLIYIWNSMEWVSEWHAGQIVEMHTHLKI